MQMTNMLSIICLYFIQKYDDFSNIYYFVKLNALDFGVLQNLNKSRSIVKSVLLLILFCLNIASS